jgi:ribosomal protein L14E/L6E/L27E
MEKLNDDLLSALSVGQVVISIRGKDVGRAYVVIGMERSRVFLVDGVRFNILSPKIKNPKHLMSTSIVFDEVRDRVLSNKKIDRGRFIWLLRASGFAGQLGNN